MRFCDARRILAVALLLSQGACSVWTPVPGSLSSPRLADAPVVRVTYDDATRVVIHRPRVEGDSVLGWSGRPDDASTHAVSVPASRVLRVERRHVSASRTALAVAGVGVGAVTFFAVLVALTLPPL
jgi:hypothetical protein